MKLGTLLLRDAVISLSQLEAALRNQILCGGRLGTNLVELDFIDLDTLTRYLARTRGVPAATQDMFDTADLGIIETFGRELAERFKAFPLGAVGNALAVATVEPDDQAAVQALALESGRKVVAHIAPELRIFYYLEKHYGIERKARYVREGTGEPAPAFTGERRRTQPARGITTPPKVRFEPKGRIEPRNVVKSRARTPKPAMSYRDACSAIDVAESREAIADVLVEYACGRFEAMVVFLIRDANAIGWRLYTAYERAGQPQAGEAPGVDALSLPLGGASALQEAHDSAGPYRGGATSVGKPVERELWSFLSLEEKAPKEMLVIPILVKRRVVNLVYAHGLEHGAIEDKSAKKLGELAKRASRAYGRLIQASKSSARDG